MIAQRENNQRPDYKAPAKMQAATQGEKVTQAAADQAGKATGVVAHHTFRNDVLQTMRGWLTGKEAQQSAGDPAAVYQAADASPAAGAGLAVVSLAVAALIAWAVHHG